MFSRERDCEVENYVCINDLHKSREIAHRLPSLSGKTFIRVTYTGFGGVQNKVPRQVGLGEETEMEASPQMLHIFTASCRKFMRPTSALFVVTSTPPHNMHLVNSNLSPDIVGAIKLAL